MSERSSIWWKIIPIGISFLVLLIAVFTYLHITTPSPEDIIKNELILIDNNEKYFYDDVCVQYKEARQDFISEIVVCDSLFVDDEYDANTFDLTVKFSTKSKYDEARVRAFFVDPVGVIRYEYPPDVVLNLSSSDGRNDLNKKINFKINYVEKATSKIYGEWHLNILLINEDNEIIAEVIESLNIKSVQQGRDFDFSLLVIVVIISFLLIILITIAIYLLRGRAFKKIENRLVDVFNQIHRNRGWSFMQTTTLVHTTNIPVEKLEIVLSKSKSFRKEIFGNREMWTLQKFESE